jgi:FHS family glucose/mannose:H+ symporter-like MFS transporter
MASGGVVLRPMPRPALVRSAMGGFFLLGCLIAFIGAFLPVWIYYVPFDLSMAGNYFLAFNLGIFSAAIVSREILRKLGMRALLVFACFLAGSMMMTLAAILSPLALLAPLVFLGFAAGVLTTGISWLMFDTLTAPMAGSILSLAAVFFGSGAVCFTLLIWATVHSLTPPGILTLTAVLPIGLGILFLGQKSLTQPALQEAPLRLSMQASRSPLGVLLSLALFFQSGNEWAVGGWLATYWIRSLGVRLETALLALAVFWMALILAKLLSPRLAWGPFRLLTAATGSALFGCLLLLTAAGVGGALAGVLFLAAGLGAAYPLILGMIGERFPYYHPGFFSGLFSLALIGGMLAPWSIGQLADAWVIEWAIGVPALGAAMVYLVMSVILLEARAARISKTAPSN